MLPQNTFSVIILVLLFGGMILCFIDIIPYTSVYRQEIFSVDDSDSLETVDILVYNVLEKNDRYEALLELVDMLDPMVVLLMETNESWEKKMMPLEKKYNHVVKEIREDTYGMMLFSKIAFINKRIDYLTTEPIPSIDVTLQINKKYIQILALHPKPPIPGEALTSQQKDLEFKRAAQKLASQSNEILQIVIGDLNDVVWSKASKKFKKQTGLKDPRVGRGTFSTFPTYAPIRFPLDQIYCSRSFKLVDLKRMPDIGSDHYPIYVKFALPNIIS